MKQKVRFVDAPPPIGGPQDPRSVWMERLRLLVERPGEWAEVYTASASACQAAANAMRLRQYHIPPGGWEFTVRSFRRGHLSFSREDYTQAVLYARYLGPDAPAANNLTELYNHSADAVWDQFGRRLCPVCETRPLERRFYHSSYPDACDECSNASALPDVIHGLDTTYRKKGCRCLECREAGRIANRARLDRAKTRRAEMDVA